MLVLSRRLNESIIIGDDHIRITVVGVRDGVVRLGIDAPQEVAVNRQEVYLAIKQHNNQQLPPRNV